MFAHIFFVESFVLKYFIIRINLYSYEKVYLPNAYSVTYIL